MTVLVLLLAVVVGLLLGLLGGGGSILMVPLLTYVAGLDPKEAIATSLVVVGVASAVSVVGHARAGRVRWRRGLLFGAAGMVGAFAGGVLGGKLPSTLLLVGFALMMIATAAAMLRGRKEPGVAAAGKMPLGRILLDGAVVGLVTGLVGAGGGFLVVPALVLLGGLPMPIAVATSFLVISMKSAAGLVGYLSAVDLNLALTASVTVAAVLGALIGGRLIDRVPADLLRRSFGWFVLAMGGFVLAQQAPEQLRAAALVAAAFLGISMAACMRYVPACPLRQQDTTQSR